MRQWCVGCVVLLGFLLPLPFTVYADSGIHIVRSGETLRGIARQHGVPVETLVTANKLANADRLAIGQRLLIPGGQPQTSFAKLQVPTPAKGSEILPGLLWPVKGRITSGYGRRKHPILKLYHFHQGIDIAASSGTPIVAARDGGVIFSGLKKQAGRVVILEHEDGFATVYAHTSQNLVEVGDAVRAGQMIALVGRSGMTTGPHLYFEVWHDGQHINPLLVLTDELPRVAQAQSDSGRLGGEWPPLLKSSVGGDPIEEALPSSSVEVPQPASAWR